MMARRFTTFIKRWQLVLVHSFVNSSFRSWASNQNIGKNSNGSKQTQRTVVWHWVANLLPKSWKLLNYGSQVRQPSCNCKLNWSDLERNHNLDGRLVLLLLSAMYSHLFRHVSFCIVGFLQNHPSVSFFVITWKSLFVFDRVVAFACWAWKSLEVLGFASKRIRNQH